ncbi:MAG: DUF4292 domain-containing protein [Chitinophagales bacterium]|nr:DUF4292 domain-containing protein [Chitinophagales bacterium]
MNKLFLLLAVIFFFSCKTPAVVTKTPAAPIAPNNNAASGSIIDSVNAHAFKFEYFSGKAKVVVNDNGDKTEFTASIRMKNDSAIWISISPALGLEAARVLMTKDSVLLIDRLHKERFSKGYNFFSKYTSLPITLQTMQDLIKGFPLFLSNQNNYEIKRNDSLIVLMLRDSTLSDSLIFSHTYLPLQQTIVADTSGSLSTINEQFDIQYTTPFSLWRKITLHHPAEMTIEITFSKIKLNEPLSFPF